MRTISLLLLALVAVFAALGQTASAQTGPRANFPAPTRTLSFGSTSENIEGLFLLHEGKHLPIVIPALQRSLPIPFTGSSIQLFREEETPQGGKRFVPVGSWEWPASASATWLLVHAAGNHRYGGLPLPDDKAAFPIRSVRVINLTGQQLAARFGDQNVMLNPLQVNAVSVTPGSKNRVVCAFGLRDGASDWQLAGRHVLSLAPDHRADLIVRHGGVVDGAPRVIAQAIVAYHPPQTAAAGGAR